MPLRFRACGSTIGLVAIPYYSYGVIYTLCSHLKRVDTSQASLIEIEVNELVEYAKVKVVCTAGNTEPQRYYSLTIAPIVPKKRKTTERHERAYGLTHGLERAAVQSEQIGRGSMYRTREEMVEKHNGDPKNRTAAETYHNESSEKRKSK